MKLMPSFFIVCLLVCSHLHLSALNNKYNVLDYGAKPDTAFLSTEAINRAISECAENGGGQVLIPAGKFKSGTIILKSNVDLHLQQGAFLYASRNAEDFPRQPIASYRSLKDIAGWYSFIYAVDQENISISGLGTIDGRGEGIRGISNAYGNDRNGRPRNILFISCRQVRVTGVKINNSAMWNQHYLNCEDVIIDKISVYNHCNGNNDGIDIDGCRRVVLTNSIIDSDDDGIVLKSTGPAPCEDIVISNCVVSSFANAIKCGTESTGGFKNISISDCVIKPTRHKGKQVVKFAPHGITGVSLEIVDGGIMSGVSVNNLTIEGTECPLYIRLGNRARKHIDEADTPGIGQIRNIQISNIMAYSTGNYSASVTGIPGAKIENVTINNVQFYNKGGLVGGNFTPRDYNNGKRHDLRADNFQDKYIESFEYVIEDEKGYPQPTVWKNLPSFGFFIRHVDGISIRNSRFIPENTDPRIPIIAVDVDHLNLKNIETRKLDAKPDVQLVDVSSEIIDGLKVEYVNH